jgi:hypothetical protein
MSAYDPKRTLLSATFAVMVLAHAERVYQAPTGSWHLDVGLRNKGTHRLHRVRKQRCLAYQQRNDEHRSDREPAILN